MREMSKAINIYGINLSWKFSWLPLLLDINPMYLYSLHGLTWSGPSPPLTPRLLSLSFSFTTPPLSPAFFQALAQAWLLPSSHWVSALADPASWKSLHLSQNWRLLAIQILAYVNMLSLLQSDLLWTTLTQAIPSYNFSNPRNQRCHFSLNREVSILKQSFF